MDGFGLDGTAGLPERQRSKTPTGYFGRRGCWRGQAATIGIDAGSDRQVQPLLWPLARPTENAYGHGVQPERFVVNLGQLERHRGARTDAECATAVHALPPGTPVRGAQYHWGIAAGAAP
jgi:hypothetical protein